VRPILQCARRATGPDPTGRRRGPGLEGQCRTGRRFALYRRARRRRGVKTPSLDAVVADVAAEVVSALGVAVTVVRI